MMFLRLPQAGGQPRQVAEVVNRILDGKINSVGTITLATGNATTTTLFDARISEESMILFVPYSAAAIADAVPYGAFQDTTDQTAASTTAAYAVTFNTTDYAVGVAIVSNSQITVRSAGIYNIQFSFQFANTSVSIQDIDIWFRKNGTDVAGSNSKFSVPNSHGGTDGHLIAALNFYIQLAAGDYVQLMWATTSTNVTLEQLPTQTSPTRPATPSAIVTINKVDESSSSDIYASNQTQGQCTVNHFANSTADKTYRYVVLG
jgi:hypothetical protein